jgi:hypothetical protein
MGPTTIPTGKITIYKLEGAKGNLPEYVHVESLSGQVLFSGTKHEHKLAEETRRFEYLYPRTEEIYLGAYTKGL